VFVVLCVIFTLYAIDAITINPKLIPLLLIVSIYLLTCKNWNIFSKENIEEFNENEKGTLVIPGNLKVAGKLIVDESMQTKDLKVSSIHSNTTHHPDVNILNKVNMKKDVNMNKDVKIDGNAKFAKQIDTNSLHVTKDVKIDGNARFAKQIDTNSLHVTGLSNSGSLNVRGDTTIGGMTKCHKVVCTDVNVNDIKSKNITVIDTLKSKNIIADWHTGAGITRIAKLHVDQLYGFAWEGSKKNTILISDNLTFSTPNHDTPLMRFTMAHNGRGDDKKQGLVLVDDAEFRIHNRTPGVHSTHFNHKTNPNSDAGFYGNWIRLGVRDLHVHDGINVGTLNVRGDSRFNGHLTVANGKHIYHKHNSKSIYGDGETKTDPNDGAIGFDTGWGGRGLHIVGIKNGGEGRVTRLHSHDTRFNKLTHYTGDGSIHRDDNTHFTIEADDHIILKGGPIVRAPQHIWDKFIVENLNEGDANGYFYVNRGRGYGVHIP